MHFTFEIKLFVSFYILLTISISNSDDSFFTLFFFYVHFLLLSLFSNCSCNKFKSASEYSTMFFFYFAIESMQAVYRNTSQESRSTKKPGLYMDRDKMYCQLIIITFSMQIPFKLTITYYAL